MFSRFIIDKDGRAGRDLLVCASKPSRPRREGQRDPSPTVAMPVYAGNKMFAQTNSQSFFCLLFFSKKSTVEIKNRDEKSPLFAHYKVCTKQLLKLLLPSFLLEEKKGHSFILSIETALPVEGSISISTPQRTGFPSATSNFTG